MPKNTLLTMRDHEKTRISQALRAAAHEFQSNKSELLPDPDRLLVDKDALSPHFSEVKAAHAHLLPSHEHIRNQILIDATAEGDDGIRKELVKVTRRYIGRGYEIRLELWHHFSTEEPTEIRSAYSIPDGHYIGEPLAANRLHRQFGITQWEKRTPDSSVCSIGYSPRRKKWYGWSHRAAGGFGVGSVLKEGNIGVRNSDGEFMDDEGGMEPGEIRTLEQARQAACEFAKCVAKVTDSE